MSSFHALDLTIFLFRGLLVSETKRITKVCNEWEEKLLANAHLINEEIQVQDDYPILSFGRKSRWQFIFNLFFTPGLNPFNGGSRQTGHVRAIYSGRLSISAGLKYISHRLLL